MRRSAILLLVAGMACAAVAADPEPVRPLSATRFVQSFNFEERNSNPNPVPKNWSRVYDAAEAADGKARRPQFPRWNQAELAFADAGHPCAGGEGCVRLPTGGGSTRLVLDPGVVPVFVGADYRVLAKVQTKDLRHARARVLIRFLERDGTPITASEKTSELIASPDAWTPVVLEVVGEFPRAAFLQVQLDLLQPNQFSHLADPAQVALPEDYAGSAYFDDVDVVQLPRAEITTSEPQNIAVWPDVPELVTRIRDLTGEQLSARIETFDAEGNLVDSIERAIAGAEKVSHVPKVTRLGWYRSVMTVSADGLPIGVDSVDFGIVPSHATSRGTNGPAASRSARSLSSDRKHFGLIAGPLPDRILELIGQLPKRIGTGTLSLDATAESTAANAPLARAVNEALEEWQDITLQVTRLRITSAAADRPLSALSSSKEALAAIEPLLDRFGQRVRRFQFAKAGDDGWFWEPEIYDPQGVARTLGRYVSGPIVSMPMRVDRTPWISTNETIDAVFFVPYAMTPGAVGEVVRAIAPKPPPAGERQSITLAFECAPEGFLSPRASAGDLVRRAIEAWVASPVAVPNMAVIEPWSVLGPRRPQLMPRAELIAWRSVTDRLIDRRIVAQFPSPPGTKAYLLGPTSAAPTGTTGAIVAWNESADAHDAVLEGFFGSGGIRTLDIFGNEKADLPPVAPNRPGRGSSGTRVALSQEPVFIEGVDTALAQFLSDFQLQPETIEPGAASGDHQIILRNPFPTGIAGTITLLSPSREESAGTTREWKVNPRVMRFSAAPGEQVSLPLAIAAGSGLELGPQAFIFQVELSAQVQYPRLEVKRDLHVGLSNVRVNLSYRIQDNDDVVLEVALANISEVPLNMAITAFAPDQARQTGTVSNLPPSNQSIRRFLYPGLAPKLRGKRLSISLLDVDSAVRVASSIEIE